MLIKILWFFFFFFFPVIGSRIFLKKKKKINSAFSVVLKKLVKLKSQEKIGKIKKKITIITQGKLVKLVKYDARDIGIIG